MGWAYGKLPDGREVGYNVEATCEHPGCTEKISRGLDAVCGGMHEGGEHGCGHYFCPKHLTAAVNGATDSFIEDAMQLCEECCERAEKEAAKEAQ